MSYRFKRTEDADDGARRILIDQLDSAAGDLSADEPEDESIHHARKALKKARSLLRLTRSGLEADERRRLNDELRAAGRALSDARDAAVLGETVTGLAEGGELGQGDLEPIASRLRESANTADTHAATLSARAAIGEARSLADRLEFGSNDWKLIAEGLERGYRQGRDAMRECRDDASDETVHGWRKRSKDLWYHQRMLLQAWPGMLEANVDAAHELSDLLGDHHDLAVLREQLNDGEREVLEKPIARRQKELLEQAVALGERLYAEKPGAYGRRLHSYWRTWRDSG